MPKLALSKTICCWCGSQGLNVYSFPSAKYQDIYGKWIEVLSEHNVPMSSSPEKVRRDLRICERHFKEDDFFIAYKSNKTRRKLLKHNSVPSLNTENFANFMSMNDQITNSETNNHESQTNHIANDDAAEIEPLHYGDEVEDICIPVACTDFIPNLNMNDTPDTHKLYQLCLRQQATIAKQRKVIEDLQIRLKVLENEPEGENDLNTEFVVHQRQNKRNPRGRRYSDEMKMLGVQMLKEGTVANYEKWRKLFVMPSRRTLERVGKKKIPLQTDTNQTPSENLQMTAVNETPENECSPERIPPLPELASTPQD